MSPPKCMYPLEFTALSSSYYSQILRVLNSVTWRTDKDNHFSCLISKWMLFDSCLTECPLLMLFTGACVYVNFCVHYAKIAIVQKVLK